MLASTERCAIEESRSTCLLEVLFTTEGRQQSLTVAVANAGASPVWAVIRRWRQKTASASASAARWNRRMGAGRTAWHDKDVAKDRCRVVDALDKTIRTPTAQKDKPITVIKGELGNLRWRKVVLLPLSLYAVPKTTFIIKPKGTSSKQHTMPTPRSETTCPWRNATPYSRRALNATLFLFFGRCTSPSHGLFFRAGRSLFTHPE